MLSFKTDSILRVLRRPGKQTGSYQNAPLPLPPHPQPLIVKMTEKHGCVPIKLLFPFVKLAGENIGAYIPFKRKLHGPSIYGVLYNRSITNLWLLMKYLGIDQR